VKKETANVMRRLMLTIILFLK